MKYKDQLLPAIAFLMLFFLAPVVISQWETDVRLTNNTALSVMNSDKSIAVNGSYLHVVWSDQRDGAGEIYYKRSTNGGVNWGSDTRLTNSPSYSEEPSISAAGSVIHVVWKDYRDGNYEIYYKRSSNNGTNWSADTRLTDNSGSSVYPCIASEEYVHVVWADNRSGSYDIYYKRSTDGGLSWAADIRISHDDRLQQSPSIAVSGSYVHIVWEDQRISVLNSEIYYRRSINVGNSWGAETRLTNNADYSEDPSVSSSGSDVHINWNDVRDGNQEIYYKRSTNAGVNWESDVRLTNNTYISYISSISVSGPIVHNVWTDDRNGNEEIYYKRSTNRGQTWGTDTRLTANVYDSRFSSVALSGQVVHVVWIDNRDDNWEIYYKRNPTGNPNAIRKVSSAVPVSFMLHQNYPNPFNPVTIINFNIPREEYVNLSVFDAAGRKIAALVEEVLSPGIYNVEFDASELASGVYFYSMFSGDFKETKKMVVVK